MSLFAEPAGHWNTLFHSADQIVFYLFLATVALVILGYLASAIIGLARGGTLGKGSEAEWRHDPGRRKR